MLTAAVIKELPLFNWGWLTVSEVQSVIIMAGSMSSLQRCDREDAGSVMQVVTLLLATMGWWR